MKVDLEELERLDALATPGTWMGDGPNCRHPDGRWIASTSHADNGTLVAVMRNALPAIIAELRAGRALANATLNLQALEEQPTFSLNCQPDEAKEQGASRSTARLAVRNAILAYLEATKGEG